MKKQLFIVTLLFLVNFLSILNAQWKEQNSGLNAGTIKCLLSTDDRIFAGTNGGGIFYSTNDGKTWIRSNNGLKNLIVNTMLIMEQTILAGTDHGLYYSTDKGSNWVQYPDKIDTNKVTSIVSNEKYLFLGAYDGVYISEDHGNNWSRLSYSGMGEITSLSVKDSFLISTNPWITSLSTDNGNTWNTIYVGTGISSLIVDSTIFLGINGYVMSRSLNNSKWKSLNNGMAGLYIYDLIIKDKILYAAADGRNAGVYKSTDLGESWIRCSNGLLDTANYKGIYALEFHNDILFAGTNGGGVYLSSDNAENWSSSNEGLNAAQIWDFTKSQNKLYSLNSWSGPYVLDNEKNNWISITNNLGISTFYCMHYFDNKIFVGTNHGLFYSSDEGNNWTSTSLKSSVYSIYSHGSKLYAGGPTGVFESTDFVNSWVMISKSIGITYPYINTIAFDANRIYAGTFRSIFYCELPDTNWKSIIVGSNSNKVYTIKIDGDSIYAATYSGIYISKDKGISWERSTEINHQTLIKVNGILIAGGDKTGINISKDNGLSWTSMNDGLPVENLSVQKLFVDGSDIYLGTIGTGVFKINIQNITSVPEKLSLLNNISPNPATDFIEITCRGEVTSHLQSDVRIYDIYGQIVSTSVCSAATSASGGQRIDVSNFARGMYFVRIGNRVWKFIKI